MSSSVASTDISFFFTGAGGPGDDRTKNLGGSISTTEIVHDTNQNWAPDIPRSVVGNPGTTGTWYMYFPFYLKNKNATVGITDGKLWIYRNINSPLALHLSKDPAGKNGTCQTILNQTTSPTGVVWAAAYTQAAGWGYFALGPGETYPMWVRISGSKGLTSIPKVRFGLKIGWTS